MPNLPAHLLVVGDETLGVIWAGKVSPSARYSEEDPRLLGLLAAPAAESPSEQPRRQRRRPSGPSRGILATGWGNELDPDHPPPRVWKILAKPYRLEVVLDAINAVLADGQAPERLESGRTDSQAHAR